MGKKSAPSPPPPPDPYKTAQAQAQANQEAVRESAMVNRINEVTPYGTVTWSEDLYYPTRTTAFNPAQQVIYDQQQNISNVLHDRALSAAANIPSSPFSLHDLPHAQPQNARDIADTYFQRVTHSLEPTFSQQRADLERSLYQRGIDPANARAKLELDRLDRAQNEQLGRLAGEAELYAGQEQSRQYGLATDQRSRALEEELLKRSQDFNEAAAFIKGAPVLAAPEGLTPAYYNVAPADVMGAVYNSAQMAQDNYAQQLANRRSTLGGLLGLGARLGSAFLG